MLVVSVQYVGDVHGFGFNNNWHRFLYRKGVIGVEMSLFTFSWQRRGQTCLGIGVIVTTEMFGRGATDLAEFCPALVDETIKLAPGVGGRSDAHAVPTSPSLTFHLLQHRCQNPFCFYPYLDPRPLTPTTPTPDFTEDRWVIE